MSEKKETIYWVNVLTFPAVLNLAKISKSKDHPIKEIRYIGRSSWPGRFFARLLVPGFNADLVKRTRYNISLADHDSHEVIFWAVCRDVVRFAWDAGTKALAADDLISHVKRHDPSKLRLYLKKQIDQEHRRDIGLIKLVQWHIHSDKGQREHKVLIKTDLWKKNFLEYAGRLKVPVFFYSEGWPFLSIIVQLLFAVLKIPVYFVFFVFSLLFSAGKKDVSANIKPAVAVYYAQRLNLVRKSDIFWWPESGISPDRLVIYFMSSMEKLSAECKVFLKKHNLPVFILPSKSFNVLRDTRIHSPGFFLLLIKGLMGVVGGSIRLLPHAWRGDRKLKFWQLNCFLWLFERVSLYESFFRSQNVKVHFGFFPELDPNKTAVNMAMDQAQGVDVFAHWSHHPTEQIWSAHDVYFSWGPYFREVLEKGGDGIKNLLYSGYIFDNLFEDLSVKALEYRRQFERSGVKFILCLFDNACIWDGGWFPPEKLTEFYTLFLKEARLHPHWGLIIKPKFYEESLARIMTKEMSEAIGQLTSEGRCLILNNAEMPTTAAQASDLAVGFGVFNTPAVETALSGIPTITYDPVHQTKHPFYKQGHNKIVFDNLEFMMDSIKQFDKDRKFSTEFADFSPELDRLDCFRDKKASARIGKYISFLLSKFDHGSNKNEAMGSANKMYKGHCGDQMVVDWSGKSFEPEYEKSGS